MYDENSMKNHIFWIKFRRIFLLLVLTIIGTAIGVIISDYIVNILMFNSIFRIIIVSSSAAIFLSVALLLTANTGKEIEDGYWKIAVYKKLAIISKKLDNLETTNTNKTSKSDHKINNEISTEKEIIKIEEPSISENTEITTAQIQEVKTQITEVSDDLKSDISNEEILDTDISKKEETV